MDVYSRPIHTSAKLEISQISSTVEWVVVVYKYGEMPI